MIDFIDKEGTSGWFTLTVVAFWLAWPLGAAVVVFLGASGRLTLWWNGRTHAVGRWSNIRSGSARGTLPAFKLPQTHAHDPLDVLLPPEIGERERREFRVYLERLRGARD